MRRWVGASVCKNISPLLIAHITVLQPKRPPSPLSKQSTQPSTKRAAAHSVQPPTKPRLTLPPAAASIGSCRLRISVTQKLRGPNTPLSRSFCMSDLSTPESPGCVRRGGGGRWGGCSAMQLGGNCTAGRHLKSTLQQFATPATATTKQASRQEWHVSRCHAHP